MERELKKRWRECWNVIFLCLRCVVVLAGERKAVGFQSKKADEVGQLQVCRPNGGSNAAG